MNSPNKKAKRFIDRIKSKGVNVEKKHLYWQHEAQKLKSAIDAYKDNEGMNEMESAVWRLIRARGPLAIQRAKHAESKYSARLAAIDAEREARLRKEKQQKQAEREKMGFKPAMENYLLEKAKATFCGRCGTTHVPPKFGGTCPALKKEERSLHEISSDLIARYKEKAKKHADELEANKQFRKATDRRMGIFRATGKQIEKTTANIKKALGEENKDNTPPFDLSKDKAKATVVDKSGAIHTASSRARHLARLALKRQVNKPTNEEVEEVSELKKTTIASYVKKASKDARLKSMVAKDLEHRGATSRSGSKKMSFAAMATDWKKKAWKREDNVNKAVDRLAEKVDQVDEISSMAHARYQDAARKNIKDVVPHISGEYGDIAKRMVNKRVKGLATSSALKLRDYLAKAKNTNEEADVHPNALHVQPVKVDGQQKYKVHAVGKNFASGIKKGEHLTDTELDDFAEMGGKIKHLKEAVFAPVMKQGTSKQAYLGSRMKCQNCNRPADKNLFKLVNGKEMCKDCQDDMKEQTIKKDDVMKKLKEIMEEMKRGRGRPRKNPAPVVAKHDSDDEHEYGPSSRPASREGSSSHIVQQLASAAHDDLPKKGRDVDFKHHTAFVPQHVAQKAIQHYASLKRSEDKANWAADHYEMHHKDFVKKFS